MELKPYQQRVIDDLSDYLLTLASTPHLAQAFREYWAAQGVVGIEPYKNTVPGVPHVCAKVPTAGGKTYIAVNAIKTILDVFASNSPNRSPFVVWLVPSLTILDQTVKNLTDPEHPYRKRLNQLFHNRVEVYVKRELLLGAGFSADTVQEQLTIVVMTFDSLRARNKEDRKIYQDNGYLASFLSYAESAGHECLLPEYDPTSLINVIRCLKPVVVVDESHNAESHLSVDMLVNLNADFIFDLTATPRNNSNIISYIDAFALKQNHMVKLPVIVANRTNRSEVIESAIILRQQLETIAKAEEELGGKYIRPIVLFQAQPRIGDDNTTYEKIKEKLIDLNISEDQIKIKTATLNELENVDLMSRDCQVRYVITVNALKEGWDCPFAYILASLADKSSAVDVEQILGRVLRMPHVQQHGHDLLNLSYVFTASSRFMATIQSVVKALNRAGFSDKDYRALDSGALTTDVVLSGEQGIFDLPGVLHGATVPEDISDFDTNCIPSDWSNIGLDYRNIEGATAEAVAFVEEMKRQAVYENEKFEESAKTSPVDHVPLELQDKMNVHKLKDIFCDEALSLKLPQFFIHVRTGGWFEDDQSFQLFERDELLKDFRLSQADASIGFEDIESEMYRVDLEQLGEQNYAPKPFKIDAASRHRFNSFILHGSRESQVRDVTARLIQLFGNIYPIADIELRTYIQRIVEGMDSEQIRDCLERDISYVRKIKQKISTLSNSHAYKVFSDYLDVDRIVTKQSFSLPGLISPSANAPSLPKSLYAAEASMGNFEGRVINDIANLGSIKWWHRNLSRGKGFRINGFINHYPDFILMTKTGKIVLLESKGDDRDNSDSELKLKLGKLWESKTGGECKYMMVFDNNPIDGAEKLSDALKKLAQL